MVVLVMTGCFSSTIRQIVVDDQTVMNKQQVILRYQRYYNDLPRSFDAPIPYSYRHLAENRSAVAVCVHLELRRTRESPSFFTTHVILQPGEKKTLSGYGWEHLLGPDGKFTNTTKLEGTSCTEGVGWRAL